MTSAWWVGLSFSSWRTFFMYGKRMQLRNAIIVSSLDQWLGLKVMCQPDGNGTLGKQAGVSLCRQPAQVIAFYSRCMKEAPWFVAYRPLHRLPAAWPPLPPSSNSKQEHILFLFDFSWCMMRSSGISSIITTDCMSAKYWALMPTKFSCETLTAFVVACLLTNPILPSSLCA